MSHPLWPDGVVPLRVVETPRPEAPKLSKSDQAVALFTLRKMIDLSAKDAYLFYPVDPSRLIEAEKRLKKEWA